MEMVLMKSVRCLFDLGTRGCCGEGFVGSHKSE